MTKNERLTMAAAADDEKKKNKEEEEEEKETKEEVVVVDEDDETAPLRAKSTEDDDDDDNEDGSSCCYDDDDEYDDEYDDDDDSLWKELKGSWKQHCFAVLVAVVATGIAFVYNNGNTFSSVEQVGEELLVPTPSPTGKRPTLSSMTSSKYKAPTLKHKHLNDYQRTANVSFCGNDDQYRGGGLLFSSSSSSSSQQLKVMDFDISKKYVPAMELHYAADILEDDDYSTVLETSNTQLSRMLQQQYQRGSSSTSETNTKIELECLQRLAKQTPNYHNHVKGLTMYYKTPNFQTYYYNYNNDAAATAAESSSSSSNANNNNNEAQQQQQQQSVILKSNTQKKIKPAALTFTGFGAKFYNLSPNPVLLFWDGGRLPGKDNSDSDDDNDEHNNNNNESEQQQSQKRLVGEIAPFEALGTATTPGSSFSISPVYDSSHALKRWVVTADNCQLYYEPNDIRTEAAAITSGTTGSGASTTYKSVFKSDKQYRMYQMQKLNQEFAKQYLTKSGRQWLAQFPRPFPSQRMWDASYIGQVHDVVNNIDNAAAVDVTAATTTTTTSTADDSGSSSNNNNYQMKVESVTPRVFSIPNFLSDEECDDLIQLAIMQGLQGSTVYSGTLAKHQRDLSTRSSTNTWLQRSATNLTDSIYRRAATLLQMDPDLLQSLHIDDDVHPHRHSLAESLQVVRYKKGEEYTAHHDFVYPPQGHRYQPTRFATLLMYLNDDYSGGQTTFPRAVNAHYQEGITIQPRKGTAALFYNMLPDGNVDDLSEHASQPVKKGEKFLANLWIWEPVIN